MHSALNWHTESMGLLLFQGISLTDSYQTSRKGLTHFQRHFWGVGSTQLPAIRGSVCTEGASYEDS